MKTKQDLARKENNIQKKKSEKSIKNSPLSLGTFWANSQKETEKSHVKFTSGISDKAAQDAEAFQKSIVQ